MVSVNQRLHNRRGIGEPRRLNDDALEVDDLPVTPLDEELAQCLLEIAPHGAAETPAVEELHLLARCFDEVVVNRDLAEFVHDHGDAIHLRFFEEPVNERCLAAAEEARNDRDGNTSRERIAPAREPLGYRSIRHSSRECKARRRNGRPRTRFRARRPTRR